MTKDSNLRVNELQRLNLGAVGSEVQTFLSCTLNPHFFRRVFCMLRYTQLYSNPCISCIFWLHHACRSTAAHAPGSGRAAADEHQAWRTAGICAAFTHNSPHSRTSSGRTSSFPELPLKSGELCGKTRHTFFGSARLVSYRGEPLYG